MCYKQLKEFLKNAGKPFDGFQTMDIDPKEEDKTNDRKRRRKPGENQMDDEKGKDMGGEQSACLWENHLKESILQLL